MYRLTLGKFFIENPQILGAIVRNLVTMAVWCPGFVHHKFNIRVGIYVRGHADKSLARPGRKQATATKLGIYSTYCPRSSIHFLAHCSNFCKPLKKNLEYCPSNQVSAAAMTSTSDEKWRTFNCFFSPGNRW